ncbi:MAG: hypothetical protein A3I05_01210 [Deltaproteobacteria bacterium RIFCSPLOWO2_02_FULL_44_10]|nr:MAG: hypothetical protein A3C46_02410 [Deltaproteobacteria bacterium RIFCSPHIGHO2_02_FULL_44_16]OGQ47343.1 MAG: hypothetical protein A3I05_01210 [Deltaproteobacteria bacterium RIFCSPLOWO2_02_FULL_44_10]
MSQKMTKKMLQEYQAGWDAVHEFELKELQNMSMTEKFKQLRVIFSSTFFRKLAKKFPSDDADARSQWKKLRKRLLHG